MQTEHVQRSGYVRVNGTRGRSSTLGLAQSLNVNVMMTKPNVVVLVISSKQHVTTLHKVYIKILRKVQPTAHTI